MNGSCRECGREGLIKRGLCIACYTRWRRARSPEECRRPTTEERFWAKVQKAGPDECWVWTGSTRSPSGHGEFHITRAIGRVPAHQFSLELATGETHPPGYSTCHHCDNPPCVNPAHLYFGTQKQNAADMIARNRAPRGENRPNARLTAEMVVGMRERFAAGEYMVELAREFGVTSGQVSPIVNGLHWKHVGGPRTTRKDQTGTTKRVAAIRKGCLKDAVLDLMLDADNGELWTAPRVHATLRDAPGRVEEPPPLVLIHAALAGLSSKGLIRRVARGKYSALEQVAVGRSFATTEREADRLHATGGTP